MTKFIKENRNPFEVKFFKLLWCWNKIKYKIQAPSNCGSEYYNYKGTKYSIVLMSVLNHNYCFGYLDIGSYDRNGVFQNCSLHLYLENNF